MSQKKKNIRFFFFLALSMITYCVCMISLFTTNALWWTLISFIVLFIALYFLAIDLYYRKQLRTRIICIVVVVLELFFFGGETRHSYVEIILFNLAILLLLNFLIRQLKYRTYFSAFAYFTQGGYAIAAILTLFFSVLMLGKYSQIPFSCEDIDSFSTNLVEAPVEAITSSTSNLKHRRNNLFSSSSADMSSDMSKPLPNVVDIASPSSHSQKSEIETFFESARELFPLNDRQVTTIETQLVTTSSTSTEKSEVELFFENTKNFFQTQAVELQGSISKNSCEFVMNSLKKIQINEGFQLAVLVLMYFLLIGVFKIVLRIISVVGFVIFILLKPFKVYTYEEKEIKKEFIK